MFLLVIGFVLFAGNAYSFTFEGCYTVPPESYANTPHHFDDNLNNMKCVEFCRARQYNLAGSRDKLCICMEALPSEVLAFPSEGDAAAGPTSSCNDKCPGDYHGEEECEGVSCCGGDNNAFSIYATGEMDFLTKLLKNIYRNKDVIKEKYPDMPDYGFVQFKANDGDNVTKYCQVSLSQPVTSVQCMDPVEGGGNLFAPIIELQVETIEEEASKSYSSRSVSLGPFDLNFDNLGEEEENELTRGREVTASTSQTYSTESGSDHSFSVGVSVSTDFKLLGHEFGVELSTEYGYSTFYNTGYECSKESSVTDSFEVTVKVPARSRKVVRFYKKTHKHTLKWRSSVKAKGEIQIFPRSGAVNMSMTEILTPSQRTFYIFGTIDGDVNPEITVKIDTYDENGELVTSKNATEAEATKTESMKKKDSNDGGKHYYLWKVPKNKNKKKIPKTPKHH